MAFDLIQQVENTAMGYAKELVLTKLPLASLLNSIQKPYRIIVRSGELMKNNLYEGIVVAKLQDNFSLSIDSKWHNFLEGITSSTVGQLMNQAMQAFSQYSLQMAVTSRRIWISTSPVSITLPMIFATETDPITDVVDQCRRLQLMALPSEPNAGGFLVPPGPSPYKNLEVYVPKVGAGDFQIKGTGKTYSIDNALTGGDQIDISIGEFLYFDNVIIKSVNITYDSRMSASPQRGRPIAAKADVNFETYQMMTKESMQKAYDNAVKFRQPDNAGPLDKIVDLIGGTAQDTV